MLLQVSPGSPDERVGERHFTLFTSTPFDGNQCSLEKRNCHAPFGAFSVRMQEDIPASFGLRPW